MRYLPHTESEIRDMLHAIGVPDIDALFAQIPASGRLGRPLALEPQLDEASLMRHLEGLADKNPAAKMVSFLGAGIYDHHVPPAVDQLLLRSEFYTAYTPYQAEVAQGTLQAIFEFQTIVAELFGMPLANASMYDGASAAAEAILMARRLTKRTRVLVSEAVHPEYLETIRTYVRGLPGGTEAIETVPHDASGGIDADALTKQLGDDTACVVVGYPNFFGCLNDLRGLANLVHGQGALLVTTTAEPYALALASPPGAQGADIAVGEGQPLGISPQFGGPGAASSPAATRASSSRTCPAVSAARRSTRTASADTCSRCRPASSTSAGTARPATSARTTRCARSPSPSGRASSASAASCPSPSNASPRRST